MNYSVFQKNKQTLIRIRFEGVSICFNIHRFLSSQGLETINAGTALYLDTNVSRFAL